MTAAPLVMAATNVRQCPGLANLIDHSSKPGKVLVRRQYFAGSLISVDHQTVRDGLVVVLAYQDDVREDLNEVVWVHGTTRGRTRRLLEFHRDDAFRRSDQAIRLAAEIVGAGVQYYCRHRLTPMILVEDVPIRKAELLPAALAPAKKNDAED